MAKQKKAKRKAKRKVKKRAKNRGTGRKNRPVKPKDKLTVMQRIFVEQYLIDPNATKAAIAAGYSRRNAQQQGSENLLKPVILTEILKARAKREKRAESSGDMVIRKLEQLAFSKLIDHIDYGPGGVKLRDPKKLTDEQLGQVESVKENRDKDGNLISLQIKMRDQIVPLINLGKHHGVIKENVEHSGTGTRIVIINDDK